MNSMVSIGERAKRASAQIGTLSTGQKNHILSVIGEALKENTQFILEENRLDLEKAKENGISEVMADRLRLTEQRICDIADAIHTVIELEDPVGIVEDGYTRPNGLSILKKRVPMGVVGIIFESRPNVTVDAAALCIKSGNAAILRGGKEAIHTNIALANVMRQAIKACGVDEDIVILVEDTTRQSSLDMMRLNGYLDVLIPRGGAGLIRAVVENATVPVIETGVGNCHTYVEKTADLFMATEILYNAKTSRPSVCNACESLLVDADIAEEFLRMAKKRLDEKQVKWLGCERTCEILGADVLPATDEDYKTEFLDYQLSVKVVSGVEEAVAHINRYNTGHSECIVTNSLHASEYFTAHVDAAAVYVNASTRFTDGGEFGLGAEIGISTQKLHARGPMGLKELTTVKYIVHGNGQIR